jgi:hypothetical protein
MAMLVVDAVLAQRGAVVRARRENVPDADDLPSVLDRRDGPVFVAADVEHRESAYL